MDKKLMSIGTSMMILRLLQEADMYGYQMIKKLEERSENVFSMKEGTLYPILHALEKEGAIESYEQAAESGRMRKYYKITQKGNGMLKEKAREWDTYQKAVNSVMGGVCYGYI
ncbi:MAG: PadR family transcriptional regulator [Lachnospiraceae bacterium]